MLTSLTRDHNVIRYMTRPWSKCVARYCANTNDSRPVCVCEEQTNLCYAISMFVIVAIALYVLDPVVRANHGAPE